VCAEAYIFGDSIICGMYNRWGAFWSILLLEDK